MRKILCLSKIGLRLKKFNQIHDKNEIKFYVIQKLDFGEKKKKN